LFDYKNGERNLKIEISKRLVYKNQYKFDEKIIKNIKNKTAREYLKFLHEYIEKNLNQKNILQGLGELISSSQKDWIKKNLKQELLNYVDFNLENYE
jgi:intergrase/recombinase